MSEPRLVFVYNADGGLFNTATDIAHKILAPDTYSCKLCALTHGYFSVKKHWVGFLDKLPVKCEFLHRDEFHARHNRIEDHLPAIYRLENGHLQRFMSPADIDHCRDLEQLKRAIREKLAT